MAGAQKLFDLKTRPTTTSHINGITVVPPEKICIRTYFYSTFTSLKMHLITIILPSGKKLLLVFRVEKILKLKTALDRQIWF